MEMLSITLKFWIKRDELRVFSSGFDWIITYYGVPSAGVICVELLNQAASRSSVRFSRASAIQKLTLFVGFLEWIRPTHDNLNLAGRLRNVVPRVLNQVLEQDRPQEELVGNNQGGVPYDPMFSDFNEMDMEWLNTIDWTHGAWMEFNV